MPVEVKVHTVPHFKTPVNGKVDLWWLEYGSYFSLQTSLLKIVRLLHKSGHFDSQLLKYIPDMTFQLPRLFAHFMHSKVCFFLYSATYFFECRAITKYLSSKFCYVWLFCQKFNWYLSTEWLAWNVQKVEEAERSYLECTLTIVHSLNWV